MTSLHMRGLPVSSTKPVGGISSLNLMHSNTGITDAIYGKRGNAVQGLKRAS